MLFTPAGEIASTRLRPFVRFLARAAQSVGGRLEVEPEHLYLARFIDADGGIHLMSGNTLGLNDAAASAIAADKHYTAQLLAAANLRAPAGQLVFSPAYTAQYARSVPGSGPLGDTAHWRDFPCYIKPNTGHGGEGVVRCNGPLDLQAATLELFQSHDILRMEEALAGVEARVIVLAGQARLGYFRHAFAITGDGQSSVSTLIAANIAQIAERRRGQVPAPDDPRLLRGIEDQGLSVREILPLGQRVALLPLANQSLGGEITPMGADTLTALAPIATAAAGALGLNWTGVDLISVENPSDAIVLELNTSPGVDAFASHSAACAAQVQHLLSDVLEDLSQAGRKRNADIPQ